MRKQGMGFAVVAILLSGCGPSAGEKAAPSELLEAQRQLAVTRVNLAEARSNYAEARRNLAEARRNLAEASEEIRSLREQLAEEHTRLTAEQTTRKEESAKAAAESDVLRKQLTDAMTELTAAQQRIRGMEEESRKNIQPVEYEITGEVFIATKGGNNFRLGHVEVAVFQRTEAEAFVKKMMREREAALKELMPRVAQADNELRDSVREYFKASDANAKASMKAFNGAEIMRTGAEQDRTREVSAKKRAEHLRLKGAQSRLMSAGFVFDQLPTPRFAVMSNAEGKFKMKVPSDLDVVVAARATRGAGNVTERYFWMVQVPRPTVGVGELTLSNDNLCSVPGGSLFYGVD